MAALEKDYEEVGMDTDNGDGEDCDDEEYWTTTSSSSSHYTSLNNNNLFIKNYYKLVKQKLLHNFSQGKNGIIRTRQDL